MQWYYAEENDNQVGPVSEDGIRELITGGSVTADTKVWNETMEDWAPAASTGLSSAFAPRKIPPPLRTAAVDDTSEPQDYPETRTDPKIRPKPSALKITLLCLLNLFLPGIAQIAYGQIAKGIAVFVPVNLLAFVYGMRSMPDDPLAAASLCLAVDACLVGVARRRGLPVGKWRFFPSIKPKVDADAVSDPKELAPSSGSQSAKRTYRTSDVLLLVVGIIAVLITIVASCANGFKGLITMLPVYFVVANLMLRWVLAQQEVVGRATMRTWALGLLMAAGIMLVGAIIAGVSYAALNQQNHYDPNWRPQ